MNDDKRNDGNSMNLTVFHKIAHIETDFPSKFGIPRQSGLADTKGRIIFEEKYQNPDAVRGIEEYSHLWLVWEFSEVSMDEWKPTVRPPRLGGNQRVGVFATRSPFRPNPIGLSCVKLDKVEIGEKCGPILYVTGADLMDGTPIFDIKPYLPYVDAYPDACGGFAEKRKEYRLEVLFPEEAGKLFDENELDVLKQILSQDPRPSYQKDPERIYGMEYAGMNIRFRVDEGKLLVCGVEGEKQHD
ncbi:MAG: tRNA (N6-threonylcarbamoyladenosine(37)-N6)-methyltransferase TrmO [Lachnospiraceae bacterium]